MDSIVLTQLKESFVNEEFRKVQQKNDKLFWILNGFKTWEEIVSYLKETNKTLYSYGNTLSWNSARNKIRHHYQCSDENDCNFWYENEYMTEDEFITYHKNIDKKYPDVSRNKYGYIDTWTK